MGFWDFLRNVGTAPVESPNVSYATFEPNVEYITAAEWAEYVDQIVAGVLTMTPAQMWRSQPHLRAVVSFVARNIAQLGLHVYERVSDTDRVRNLDNPFSRALRAPGDHMTGYDLVYALVVDKMLYDRAYWIPWYDGERPRIRRIPPTWLSPVDKGPFGVERYRLTLPAKKPVLVNRADLVVWDGYSPTTHTGCSPTLEALKETLAEQIEATKYRNQVWRRGGRVSSVIERPAEAPSWTDTQAKRFREDWRSNFTADGPNAGGTPILEDGMTIRRMDFSAREQEWVDGTKLAFNTVASAFHVNPTMVGLLDNANYSNVREFRRMLYGDTLGPTIREIEDLVVAFVFPLLGMDQEGSLYPEFNIAEKLQGSFEEQAAVLQTSVGRPWMTADEARGRVNLPALGGDADRLVLPLNVVTGGQASPTDSGSQNRTGGSASGPVRTKARAPEPYQKKVEDVVRAFFHRQEAAVRSTLGGKAFKADWWDEERWNRELADDLYRLSVLVSEQVATATLEKIGYPPEDYDVDRTLAWLREVADRSSSGINDQTRSLLQDALDAEDVPAALDNVFAQADSRSTSTAVSTVTLLSGFAAHEAAKQVAGDKATKTWVAGANARAAHAALDGETVALSENFSNGAAWPGDGSALGAEDLANCNCSLDINVP